MKKIHYIIQEKFASTNEGEREAHLQNLMDEYIRTLEKQIAQNEFLG